MQPEGGDSNEKQNPIADESKLKIRRLYSETKDYLLRELSDKR